MHHTHGHAPVTPHITARSLREPQLIAGVCRAREDRSGGVCRAAALALAKGAG
jgi:hypothetical protein